MTTHSTFHDLGIAEPLIRTLTKKKYGNPTPIQVQAIPFLLEKKDLWGVAQTGTGKTAAFALPLLHHLFKTQCALKPRTVRALILAPTRELVIQIMESCKVYGEHLSLRQTCMYGGVSQHAQVKALSRGVDLLIATPGRLIDLMEQGHIYLHAVAHLVLDEADRMLDMGFIKPLRKIIAKTPQRRQTLLFSATMPDSIHDLAHTILTNPERVEITPQVVAVEKIDQSVFFVKKKEKTALLVTLLQDTLLDKTIIFGKTKHDVNRIVQELDSQRIPSSAFHSNKSQAARQKALEAFRKGDIRVLVATDIMARGIDIKNISHVINYDLPNEPENYVHRIGRTARAGTGGIAFSFCDDGEKKLLRDIERVIRLKLPIKALPTLEKMDILPPMPREESQLRRESKDRSLRREGEASKDSKRKNKRSEPGLDQKPEGFKKSFKSKFSSFKKENEPSKRHGEKDKKRDQKPENFKRRPASKAFSFKKHNPKKPLPLRPAA